jgi:hypothetical protein
MYRDPIIEEIHQLREAVAGKFGFNIRKVVEYYLEMQKRSQKPLVNIGKFQNRVADKPD